MPVHNLSGTQTSSTRSVAAKEFFSTKENRSEYSDLVSIFDHWNELHGDCFAPKYADFKISDLEYGVIPYCAVVDVIPEGPIFNYRFWGTALVEIINFEMTGKNAHDLMPESLAEAAVKAYSDVMELGTATVTIILMQQVYGVTAKTVTLRLPMSSNQTDIDVIFSAVVMSAEDKKDVSEVSKSTGTQ
jgi:hypothetical protein